MARWLRQKEFKKKTEKHWKGVPSNRIQYPPELPACANAAIGAVPSTLLVRNARQGGHTVVVRATSSRDRSKAFLNSWAASRVTRHSPRLQNFSRAVPKGYRLPGMRYALCIVCIMHYGLLLFYCSDLMKASCKHLDRERSSCSNCQRDRRQTISPSGSFRSEAGTECGLGKRHALANNTHLEP